MPVIAMNQEMGSHGRLVAEAVAKRLGLDIVRHQITEHVAEKMHVRKSTLQRYLEGKAGLLERWGTDETSLALYRAEEVLDFANRGNALIRGWGAVVLLRPISHVVRVRVTAPFDTRLRWLMDRLQMEDEEELQGADEDFAARELRHSDANQEAFMRHQFGLSCNDPSLYDLVVNTQRVSVESAAEQIVQLVGRPEFQEVPESHNMLANLTLEYHVRAALRKERETADVHITVVADGGHVTLEGIVVNEHERRVVGKISGEVSGVQKLSNNLKVMKGTDLFSSSKA